MFFIITAYCTSHTWSTVYWSQGVLLSLLKQLHNIFCGYGGSSAELEQNTVRIYLPLFKMNIPSSTVLWWKEKYSMTSSSPAQAQRCWLTSSIVESSFPEELRGWDRRIPLLSCLWIVSFIIEKQFLQQLYISHSSAVRDFVGDIKVSETEE